MPIPIRINHKHNSSQVWSPGDRYPIFLQVYPDVAGIDITIIVDGILGNGVPIGVETIEKHVFPDHYTTMEIIGDRVGNNPVVLRETLVRMFYRMGDIDTVFDITTDQFKVAMSECQT